jgi:hypothetical protein
VAIDRALRATGYPKYIKEDVTEILRGAPVEIPNVKAFSYYSVELFLKSINRVGVFFDDLVTSVDVDSDASEAHFKDGALEFALEVVGGGGVLVQLWLEDIEKLAGDSNIEAVVNLRRSPLIEG